MVKSVARTLLFGLRNVSAKGALQEVQFRPQQVNLCSQIIAERFPRYNTEVAQPRPARRIPHYVGLHPIRECLYRDRDTLQPLPLPMRDKFHIR